MYREDLRRLKMELTALGLQTVSANAILPALEAATVDAYQGRERKVMIINLVSSKANQEPFSFMKDARRLNVATTRAKEGPFIVADGQNWRSYQKNPRNKLTRQEYFLGIATPSRMIFAEQTTFQVF